MSWHEIEIEIVDILKKGTCTAGHKIGDKFEKPEDRNKICSAAYHTMYPYIIGLQAGGSFPWEDDPDVVTLCCPDYKNPVVFKITRKKSSE